MRYKKELYEKEQAEIVDEILEILSLKENKITLYELENDLEKQEKIINLIPKIRKLKLNGYWNRLRSEQKMINRFSKIFGKPTDTIICIGDFEQRKHRKFKEPLKGKGFRTLFRKSGYKVYLVDEFRTSCKCSNCDGGDCNKFRKCRNPKPMKNNSILSHGVLMCKTCSALWNRDENSSRNIYKIAYNAIHQKERPIYLDRSKVISGTTSVDRLQCHSSSEESAQPQFTRSETGKPC